MKCLYCGIYSAFHNLFSKQQHILTCLSSWNKMQRCWCWQEGVGRGKLNWGGPIKISPSPMGLLPWPFPSLSFPTLRRRVPPPIPLLIPPLFPCWGDLVQIKCVLPRLLTLSWGTVDINMIIMNFTNTHNFYLLLSYVKHLFLAQND